MPRNGFLIAISFTIGACGGGTNKPSPADSAAMAQHVADSALAAHTQAAPALAEEARGALAKLLRNPASAVFDSLVVTQPAISGGVWPDPAVCGRIGAKQGTGLRTPFIYRNSVTVFVLDQSNKAAFADLRVKLCDGPGTKILLK